MPTDLTEIKPLERRVDTLLRIEDAEGTEYLLAAEAQTASDPKKTSSWAYYVAHLHAKYELPVVLLVICRVYGTARWAARPARIGLTVWPTLTLHPLVLGPENLPSSPTQMLPPPTWAWLPCQPSHTAGANTPVPCLRH